MLCGWSIPMAEEHRHDEQGHQSRDAPHGLFIGDLEGILPERRLDMRSFEQVHDGGLSSFEERMSPRGGVRNDTPYFPHVSFLVIDAPTSALAPVRALERARMHTSDHTVHLAIFCLGCGLRSHPSLKSVFYLWFLCGRAKGTEKFESQLPNHPTHLPTALHYLLLLSCLPVYTYLIYMRFACM